MASGWLRRFCALSCRMTARRFGTGPSVRRWCTVIAAAVHLSCGGAPLASADLQAATGSPSREEPLPVPADLRAGIERAVALGTHLFQLEASTAQAWDALTGRAGSPEGVGHYLALMGGRREGQLDGAVQVLFFTDEHVPRLSYQVHVSGGPEPSSRVIEHDPPRLVHDPLMSLLNARLLALEALPPTAQRFNPVLIPHRDGHLVVYLLAASRQPGVAVLGRHYRVDVSEDGSEVENVTALSPSQLELSTRDRAGQRLAALTISEQGAEHPSEAHVFASRTANLPIYVNTSRGRWKVGASAIQYLGPR